MDHDIDYREIMADLLKRRRKLAAVRLQVIPAAPQVTQLLCSRLELTHKRVFVQKSPLDLSFFFKLTSRMESDGHPELFYSSARPMLPPQDYDLTAEVEKHDVLLSYPYQSIRPFIAMLKKAAQDPDVISIKMTLYRMARESQIVQALVEAAENGKEVVALVELRARFDEQNNIDWSKHLEEAGCTVIYGFDDYKVHSKLTLITKKSAHGYSYITQIGTGNYNEKTSELYTDYSFITADLGIGEEASNVFQNLAVQKLTEESEKMLVAPLRFKSVLLDEMVYLIARDNEAEGFIQETTSHPQWFECLCRRAVASNENEAKWQFAAYLPECSCSQEVRDIILDFAKDPNEYVSRRALLAMPALRPDCVEQFAPLFWERNCYSPELQEYQRIAVLVSLDAIHSDLLPQYLEQAKQDGRRYLLEHAERIEGGLL